MFSSMKLYAAVLAFSATAKAISNLEVPGPVTSGGSITITWSSESDETTPCTVALFSTNPSYNGPYAIANNVNPQDNKAVIPLPEVVPGPGYTVRLISMSDTSKELASSTTFSIGDTAPGTTAKPASASTLSAKHTSGSASHSGTATASHSGSASASATHSGSVVSAASSALSSVTAPIASASSAARSALSSAASAAHSALSSAASSAASASASARTGAALAIRVPAAGLALVLGGLLVGAWAV